jgi:galactokinase
LAFFLKKNKLEIDRLSEIVRNLELSDATKSERLKTIGKVLEDRRRDVQKLFEKIK